MANGKRRPTACADHKVLLVGEHDGESERAVKTVQSFLHGLPWRFSLRKRTAQQMRNHLGVGLGGESHPPALQLGFKLTEVFDNPVVYDGNFADNMRVRIGLIGRSVSGPARMANARAAVKRSAIQLALKLRELSRRAQPLESGSFQSGYAGGVIAAILKTPESRNKARRYRCISQNSNDATHALFPIVQPVADLRFL
jgi:hypothetical protein